MTSLILRNQNQTPSFFDSFFGGSFLDDVLQVPLARTSSNYSVPQVRVDAKEGAYDISIAAPGLPKNAVDVSVRENVLTVAHEHKEEGKNNYFCSSFTKSWTLPNDVDIDKITAKYDQGIFNVSVPRVQPVEPEVKKIKIK